jgi:hypothetical protein
MTHTERLIGFVAMTTAIVTILLVGTLAAADILHFRSRRPAAESEEPREPEPAGLGVETSARDLASSGSDSSRR